MIKKIILLLMALAAIYGAVMSPFSLTETLAKKDNLERAITERDNTKKSRDNAYTLMVNSKNAFESQRTFDVHYTDIYKIKQLIDVMSGVSFAGLYEVDPKNGYMLGATLNIEDYNGVNTPKPSAVQLSIIAENTAAGLNVVNTMELPIVSITTVEPGRIDIIFLTGGDS